MSPEQSQLERALANQVVSISVSDSPDLGRLGLLERSLRQTVAALAPNFCFMRTAHNRD